MKKPSFPSRTLALAIHVSLCCLAAGPFARADAARAKKIENASELCFGPMADGRIGDYLLENSKIRVVISGDATGRPSVPGGAIIDVGNPPYYLDPLRLLFAIYQSGSESHGKLASISVVDSKELPQGAAAIEARVEHNRAKGFIIATRYELEADARDVRIHTVIQNGSKEVLPRLVPGDLLILGNLRLVLPDLGIIEKSIMCETLWVGGYAAGGDTNLGVTCTSGTVGILNFAYDNPRDRYSLLTYGSDQTVPIGQSMEWERYLRVGGRDFAEIPEFVFRARKTPTATFEGLVYDQTTSKPVAGCPLEIFKTYPDQRPAAFFAFTLSDEQGRYHVAIPKGSYFPWAVPNDRPPTKAIQASEPLNPGGHGGRDVPLEPATELSYRIVDGPTGEPCPAKLTFVSVPPAPAIEFGPPYRAAAGRSVCLAEGEGKMAIKPGAYQVIVSRGIEYNVVKTRLAVGVGKTNSLFAKLDRVVDTAGYVSVDIGSLTRASFDGLLSPADRLITAAAEGVEVVVTGDDGVATDLSRDPMAAKLRPWVKTVVGKRIRLSDTGRPGDYTVFPVDPSADNAAFSKEERAAKDSFELARLLRKHYPGALVQLNRAALPGEGLFAAAGYKPDAPDKDRTTPSSATVSCDFDLLEITDGQRLDKWKNGYALEHDLIRAGKRFGITGSSYSRGSAGQEIGYPRTYVPSSTDDPAKIDPDEIIRNLKAGKTFVTNGPFIVFKAEGQYAGGFGTATGKTIELEMTAQRALWVNLDTIDIHDNGAFLQKLAFPPNAKTVLFPNVRDKESPLFTVALKDAGKDKEVNVLGEGMGLETPVLARDEAVTSATAGFMCVSGPIYIDGDGDGKCTPLPVR